MYEILIDLFKLHHLALRFLLALIDSVHHFRERDAVIGLFAVLSGLHRASLYSGLGSFAVHGAWRYMLLHNYIDENMSVVCTSPKAGAKARPPPGHNNLHER